VVIIFRAGQRAACARLWQAPRKSQRCLVRLRLKMARRARGGGKRDQRVRLEMRENASMDRDACVHGDGVHVISGGGGGGGASRVLAMGPTSRSDARDEGRRRAKCCSEWRIRRESVALGRSPASARAERDAERAGRDGAGRSAKGAKSRWLGGGGGVDAGVGQRMARCRLECYRVASVSRCKKTTATM
jgi:hypothetical protein